MSRWAVWLLRLVALVLIVAGLHTVYCAGVIALFHPHQIDREEGFLLNQAVVLRSGGTIYGDLKDYPFLVGNYTPIYPALMAVFIDPYAPELAVGRWISLASLICILIAGSVVVYLNGKVFECCAIMIGILLTSYNVKYWVPFARVDFLALALGFLGLVLVVLWQRFWVVALAGVLFVAAFFTKQTQVVAPVVALVVLLAGRHWRLAGVLAGVGIVGGVLLGLGLLLATGGRFWEHTVTFNRNVFEGNRVWLNARHLWRFDAWWFVALGVLVVLQWGSWRVWVWAAGFTILAALMALTIGKVGSDVNYLLELELAAAVWLGLMLGCEFAAPRGWSLVPVLFLGFYAGGLFLMPNRVILFQPAPESYWNVAPGELQELLGSFPGDVLSEDAVVVLQAGRDVLYQPFIMTQLAAGGLWDDGPLLGDLRSGRFAAIVTYDSVEGVGPMDGFGAEARRLINERYRLAGEFLFYPGRARHVYVRQ